jgi:hypothetical protein
MAKSSAKTLKDRYDKFKKDCISTYWEFKHISRKLKSLSKRAAKLAEGIGKLTVDGGESDPILIFRLGDFPALVDSSLIDIDATLYNIQHSSFKRAIPSEKKRMPCYAVESNKKKGKKK